MSINNNSYLSVNEDHKCPITRDIMLNPVAANPCGHIFERAAIEQWMERNLNCPLDRKEIVQLIPQVELRAELHAFITQHPDLFDNMSPQEREAAVNASYGSIQMSLEELHEDAFRQLFFQGDIQIYRRRLEQMMQRAENIQERPFQLADPDRPGQFVEHMERTGEVRIHGRRYLVTTRTDGTHLGIRSVHDNRQIGLRNCFMLACLVATVAVVIGVLASLTPKSS